MAENQQEIKKSRSVGYLASMGIMLLLLGAIISSQTIKHRNAEKSRIPETRQIDQLVLLLKDTENKKNGMEKQLARLRQQVHEMDVKSLPAGLSNPQLQRLYQIAGLTSIKGLGIEIKLVDASITDKSFQGYSQDNNLINNDGLIHSDDILKIINELKAAGATALSVNNQRIITTSEIVTAGSSIMVNQARVIPPYVIKAVGPADTMISALKMRGGIAEFLEAFGIQVTISKKNDLKVTPYTGSL